MLNERKLTKTELEKREDIIMNMKKNKRALVKQYGKDAEAVMYGRATNQAKKQSESMKNTKLTELIKDALKNPKAADLNKDGKLSDYEEKRGAAIEKNTVKEWGSSDQSTFNQSIHKYLGEPTKMPSPFDSILRSAAEDAVDFHWDDWEEYKTDYEGLVDKAIKGYLRSYFSDEFNMMVKMFEPVKEEKRGATIEKNIKESDPSIPLNKDFTYDYEDIGQFYLEGFNRPHSLTQDELGILGKKIVNQLYKGDIEAAYDDLVGKKLKEEDQSQSSSLIGRMGDKSLKNYKSESADELQMIMDKLYELSDQAKQIIKSEFPSEYSELDAYGALDFGSSSNPNDITFEKALEDLEIYQDDDEDLMDESYKPSHRAYDVIDGDRNVVYKNLPRHIAIEKAGEREDYKFTATDSLAEDLDIDHQKLEDMGYSAGEKALMDLDPKIFNQPNFNSYASGFIKGFRDNIEASQDYTAHYVNEGKPLEEALNPEVSRALSQFIKAMAKRYGYSEQDAVYAIMAALKQREFDGLNEDLDIGHEDNEPGMLKAELYHIGSYAMELYKMMDDLEGMGEVDFPAWWQSKITTAKNNISGAKHYLEFELKEPAIDAMVTEDNLEEIGMFNDPVGYEKSQPDSRDEVFTKKYVSSGVYDIFKNGEKVKTINGEGEANAWMNAERGKAVTEENLDDEAKIHFLQQFKKGNIDTLPEDPKAELVKKVLNKLSKDKK